MPTTQKKLEELDKLIEGIETAMFTTRRHDGHLVSRPMATQERIRDTDLLHSSVVITAGERFNNPRAELARIDDLGTITKPVAGIS